VLRRLRAASQREFGTFKEYCGKLRDQQASYFRIMPVFPVTPPDVAPAEELARRQPSDVQSLREQIEEWLLDENTPPRERQVFLRVAERTGRNMLRLCFGLPQQRAWLVDAAFVPPRAVEARLERDLRWLASQRMLPTAVLPESYGQDADGGDTALLQALFCSLMEGVVVSRRVGASRYVSAPCPLTAPARMNRATRTRTCTSGPCCSSTSFLRCRPASCRPQPLAAAIASDPCDASATRG
jgi:hypothetical protein